MHIKDIFDSKAYNARSFIEQNDTEVKYILYSEELSV
jgi:hypothetical protein